MNPRVDFGSRTNEDPHELVNEVYKILCAVGFNEKEKVELVAFQLEDVAQVWYRKC